MLITAPIVPIFVCLFLVLLCNTLCPFRICNHLAGEERAGCFTLIFSHTISEFPLFYSTLRAGRTSICDVTVMIKITTPCRISAYSGFSGSLFHVFHYKIRH